MAVLRTLPFFVPNWLRTKSRQSFIFAFLAPEIRYIVGPLVFGERSINVRYSSTAVESLVFRISSERTFARFVALPAFSFFPEFTSRYRWRLRIMTGIANCARH